MPTYDYLCPANGQRLTVYHAPSVTLEDWGSLCALAGRPPGSTPPGAAVERQIGGGFLLRAGRADHGVGTCCGQRGCA